MRIDYLPYRPGGPEPNRHALVQRPDSVAAQAIVPADGVRRVMRDLPQVAVDPQQPLPGQQAQRAYQSTEAMGRSGPQFEGFEVWA